MGFAPGAAAMSVAIRQQNPMPTKAHEARVRMRSSSLDNVMTFTVGDRADDH
jgi:hypothetical protein